jgi:hypothetical protein
VINIEEKIPVCIVLRCVMFLIRGAEFSAHRLEAVTSAVTWMESGLVNVL